MLLKIILTLTMFSSAFFGGWTAWRSDESDYSTILAGCTVGFALGACMVVMLVLIWSYPGCS